MTLLTSAAALNSHTNGSRPEYPPMRFLLLTTNRALRPLFRSTTIGSVKRALSGSMSLARIAALHLSSATCSAVGGLLQPVASSAMSTVR